ncbi:MAG: hypothetical protein ACLFWL_18895 [Candidatus Brocadiia bacterium]
MAELTVGHSRVVAGARVTESGKRQKRCYGALSSPFGWFDFVNASGSPIGTAMRAVKPSKSVSAVNARMNPAGMGIDSDHDGSSDSKDDSDNDGICDWDEQNRWFKSIDIPWTTDDFKLDPNDADTDGDGVPDLEDLKQVLEEQGYRSP